MTFQDVDRPPFHHASGWDVTLARWDREAGVNGLNLRAYFNTDHGFEYAPVPLGMYPPFEKKLIEDQGDSYIERDERGIVWRQRKDRSSMPAFLDHPVKSWDDWEQIKKERLDPDHPGRHHTNWQAFGGYIESIGGAAALGNGHYGVFGSPRYLMGTEPLLRAFIEQPDLVHDMMDYLTDFWIRIYDRVTEHVKVACIHIWEDMAGRQGSLISPKMVRDFMMPNYRKIKEFADSKGIPLISVDSDGDVSELVPIMMENGVNLFFPFEVQAGSDVEEYRRKYPRLGMMGGLDKRALAEGKEAIDREIDRAARVLPYGGFIARPDHAVPPDVSLANYKYFMDRLRELIGKK